MSEKRTVSVTVDRDIDHVWQTWTLPGHIINWNFANKDWICPSAINDLEVGGQFIYRMEAIDGSDGFTFMGIYTEIIELKKISYKLDGGREVSVNFSSTGDGTEVTEEFEVEDTNSAEMQRVGWLAILNNFKKYSEDI